VDKQDTRLTAPILSSGPTLWFSAYAFGWGYCAFEVTSDVVCEQLGAADVTSRQLMLAFELGRRRILQAVERKTLPRTGERIVLSATDLAPEHASAPSAAAAA
jgi:hypothetical protein